MRRIDFCKFIPIFIKASPLSLSCQMKVIPSPGVAFSIFFKGLGPARFACRYVTMIN